jgi:hypothetical protein
MIITTLNAPLYDVFQGDISQSATGFVYGNDEERLDNHAVYGCVLAQSTDK